MSRLRLALAGALVAVVVLLVAAGTVSAQSTGINISGAEIVQSSIVPPPPATDVNVTGTGTCVASGTVTLKVALTDEVTGGAGHGVGRTECVSAGEHIQWLVTVTNVFPAVRPGDKANVTATAGGGISGTDQKEVIVQQFH